MSTLHDHEPHCAASDASAVALRIEARPRDLGGFSVRRVLPAPARKMVGPFIFFDHMGPADFAPGGGIDVRPHPHIALATVTYLFEGEILHRDSLGSLAPIRPGDVNWMVAGSGIVHSERTDPELRARGMRLHGIQSWVALPTEHEEIPPRFEHHPAHSLPRREADGVRLDVIAGKAFGMRSPVGALSDTLYVHALLEAGAVLRLPAEHAERGVYVVEGELDCDGDVLFPGTLAVLRTGGEVPLRAAERTRLMIVGGAKLEGERYVSWNFVSSSRARITRAEEDWRAGRFPKVPGDEHEFIPLPER
jgi:redox-sensitive bicupin YhaK (pirin superfamily)